MSERRCPYGCRVDPDGWCWGTPEQIAAHIGKRLTATAVRNWARPGTPSRPNADVLPTAIGDDRIARHPLQVAQQIDLRKRRAGKGRPRAT